MKRIKTYWLLLLVLIYTATAVLSVGQTQARYENTASWDTVLGEAEEMVTSDLLQSVTGPNVTVLLGEMPRKTYQIPITLTSGADVEGELTWEVEQPGYLTVEMSVDNTALAMDDPEAVTEEKGNLVRLEAGKPVTVMMRLIPEKDIFTAPRSAEKVLIHVYWGNSLQGSFLVEFPAVEEEPEETEPEATEPEATKPEETEPVVTEPEATEPEATEPEVTEPEETEPQATEPQETNPEATEPESTEPDMTDPVPTIPENSDPEQIDPENTDPAATDSVIPESDNTEPLSDEGKDEAQIPEAVSETEPTEEVQTEKSEKNVDPTNPDNNENTSLVSDEEPEANEPVPEPQAETTDEGNEADGTEPESRESEQNAQSGVVGGLQDFIDNNNQDKTGEEDSDSEEKEDTFVPGDPVDIAVVADERFDADSRCTVKIVPPNDVNKLQFGLGLTVRPTEGSGGAEETVLGNFPRFLCYSYDGGDHYYMLYNAGLIEVAASPKRTLPLLLDFSRTKVEGEELVIAVSGLHGEFLVGSGSAVVSVKPQETVELSSRFLSEQQSVRVEIPESWKDYTSEVIIEMLTCSWDEEGTVCEMVYRPVEPEKIGLKLETEKNTGALTLKIGDVLPLAGTYRISINWTNEEECIAMMQENFFINYLAYHKVAETGGAEQ